MIKCYNNNFDKNKYLVTKNYRWKGLGIIFKNEEDKNYWGNRYYNSINCELCNKQYKSTKDRQLDHNHITGEPRNVICNRCNCMRIDRKINSNNKYSKNIYFNNNKNKFLFDKKVKGIRFQIADENLNKLVWIKFSILLLHKDKLFT